MRRSSPDPTRASDLLAILAPERRQAILDEALRTCARELFTRHESGTLGDLFDALTDHSYWEPLRALPLASLASPAPPPGKAKREAEPPADDPVATVVYELAQRLGEHAPRPLADLRRVVDAYGAAFAQTAYEKTLAIEASGGMVRDGLRRTPGDVFFFLTTTDEGRRMLGAPPPRPQVKPTALIDALLTFMANHPGRRRDEIWTHFGGDRLLVSAALETLRVEHRVRTVGSGRRMTYFVAV